MINFNDLFFELLEKRRNPEQNPKIGIVQALEQYKDDPDIYISFTNVDKIGINPQSNFNTPNGIYTYPLKEMWSDIKQNTIPFGGDRPYVWIIRSKNKKIFIKDLYSDYTSKDYNRDMEKIRKIYKNNKNVKKQANFDKKTVEQFIDAFISNCSKKIKSK